MAHDRIPDSHRDLLEAEVATLATVGEDGYPQVSEVWFLAEGDQIAISLNTSRQKTKNLRTEPGACTLFILDLANPYRYLEIRGTADLAPDDDYEFADKVGAKYGGPTCASTTGRVTAGWSCGSSRHASTWSTCAGRVRVSPGESG